MHTLGSSFTGSGRVPTHQTADVSATSPAARTASSLVFAPEPGLRVCRRVMACAAKTVDIRTLEDAVEHIPTGVLARMAADIASGAVWELVREALAHRTARYNLRHQLR
jgi:hypothetical protein